MTSSRKDFLADCSFRALIIRVTPTRFLKGDLRSPKTSTASWIGFTMATIIHYEKLLFALMRVLEVVQLCLEGASGGFARNLPLLYLERKLRCKHVMQLGDLSMHLEVVVHPAKQKNENAGVGKLVCCVSRREGASKGLVQIVREYF